MDSEALDKINQYRDNIKSLIEDLNYVHEGQIVLDKSNDKVMFIQCFYDPTFDVIKARVVRYYKTNQCSIEVVRLDGLDQLDQNLKPK